MALFARRNHQPVSIETEHERLRAIRIAAEQELGRLRRELTERVAAVEARERELVDALGRLGRSVSSPSSPTERVAMEHARVGIAAHAQELQRREKELDARESVLFKMESDLTRRAAAAAETPEERLAHIEGRLAALQEAEKAFTRTQAELAVRSDELAAREAELDAREHSGLAAGAAVVPNRAELTELDERLRRLERQTREASMPRGFGDDLRTLERKGLRGPPPGA